MKHLTQFVLAVLVALARSAYGADYDVCQNGLYFRILSENDRTCEVVQDPTGYTSKSYSIPEGVLINGKIYTVTRIGNGAFENDEDGRSSYVESIEFPNTVTEIGNWAFHNAPLKSISLPNSLISIGEYAFMDCYYLKSVVLPPSLTIINKSAFEACEQSTRKCNCACKLRDKF